MEMRGIRVGMQGIKVGKMGMQGIGVEMPGIEVEMRGIRMGTKEKGMEIRIIRMGMRGIGRRNKENQSENLPTGVEVMKKMWRGININNCGKQWYGKQLKKLI